MSETLSHVYLNVVKLNVLLLDTKPKNFPDTMPNPSDISIVYLLVVIQMPRAGR